MSSLPKFDRSLIVDVGAHLGEDSDFYLRLGYRVVAVEANPQLVSRLADRFGAAIRAGRYTLVPKAVGEADGEIEFFVNDKVSVWGTADPGWAERNRRMGAESHAVKVPCVSFAQVLRDHGCPYYLKIDIEGADMMCLRALKQVTVRPRFVSIESNKTAWPALLEEFALFESLGYDRFKVVDQREHAPGRFLARDGAAFEHRFESDSSGRFGEQLEGSWLSKEQAIDRYRSIFRLYRTVGDNKLLGKVLTRIPLLRRIPEKVSWYDTHAMRSGALP
jgi:FkbM family methyltransferase